MQHAFRAVELHGYDTAKAVPSPSHKGYVQMEGEDIQSFVIMS
jgi:hypothetical protein